MIKANEAKRNYIGVTECVESVERNRVPMVKNRMESDAEFAPAPEADAAFP